MGRDHQPIALRAVIEIGTTAIRMAVAEGGRGKTPRLIDSLQQGVSLGRESVAGRDIPRATIEACIDGLQTFLQALEEYGLAPGPNLKVVATSAVREAPNRDQFLNRVTIATGLSVHILEQADVNRLVYQAVRPGLKGEPFFREQSTVVFEVGGGSTDVLVFRRGKVSSSHLYRLGAQRVQRMLKQHGDPARVAALLREQTQMPVEQIAEAVGPGEQLHLVALGSEMRFVAGQLGRPSAGVGMQVLGVAALASFAEEVLSLSARAASARFGLSAQEVEMLPPMLLINLEIATRLKAREIIVSQASLRDGLLAEMTGRGTWTREFRRQIMNSTREMGRHYEVDLRHGRRVAKLAQAIFAALRESCQLSERDAVILEVATVLYESGLYISPRSHHKHSMYLIQNSDIFGLSRHNLSLVALVARYHRGSVPKPGHEIYRGLSLFDRIRVQKLAAILRLAHAVSRHQQATFKQIVVELHRRHLDIAVAPLDSLAVEQVAASGGTDLFEMVYGRTVRLRRLRRSKA
jgi:exopolyphosphatase/guanosine-5'-triphosphate,3'-diphosphate pyrophosphatase